MILQYMHTSLFIDEVNTFCYPSATLSKDGSCETEIKIRLALTTSAIIRI